MDVAVEDLVAIRDVAREQGVPASSLIRRIKRRGFAMWVSPTDGRMKLVTRADAEALKRPLLVFGGQQGETAAA